MNYYLYKLDRNFHEKMPAPEVGTICELVSVEYFKDYMQWGICLKEIGKPVDKSPSVKVEYK